MNFAGPALRSNFHVIILNVLSLYRSEVKLYTAYFVYERHIVHKINLNCYCIKYYYCYYSKIMYLGFVLLTTECSAGC